MNDIGPPVGLQVNPLETEPVAGEGGLREATGGNKILTSSVDPRTDGLRAQGIIASSALFFFLFNSRIISPDLAKLNFDSVRRSLL